MNAYEWGLKYDSCPEALKWRRNLGKEATQADAWRLCQRGDWMMWQLCQLSEQEQEAAQPKIAVAIDRIVARAIRRAMRLLRGNRVGWTIGWRRWAREWLSGKDRSCSSARSARSAAAAAAAYYGKYISGESALVSAASAWVAAAASAAASAAWLASEDEDAAEWAAEWAAETAWFVAGAELAAVAENVAWSASSAASVAWSASWPLVPSRAAEARAWSERVTSWGASAVESEVVAASRNAELRVQVRDIHRELPEWPGGEL